MGYGVLLGGIFVLCGLVSGVLAKSTNDKKYQPEHIINQEEIKDLIKQKRKLENLIKEKRELTAEEINKYNVEIERISRILKEAGLSD